jgi:hypothetical protein
MIALRATLLIGIDFNAPASCPMKILPLAEGPKPARIFR